MLEKMGWKKGEGLGKEGTGMKDPVRQRGDVLLLFDEDVACSNKMIWCLSHSFHHRSNWKSESPSQVWGLVPPCLWTASPRTDPSPRRTGRKRARDSLIRASLTCCHLKLRRTRHPKHGSEQKRRRQQTHNQVLIQMAKIRNALECIYLLWI